MCRNECVRIHYSIGLLWTLTLAVPFTMLFMAMLAVALLVGLGSVAA